MCELHERRAVAPGRVRPSTFTVSWWKNSNFSVLLSALVAMVTEPITSREDGRRGQ